LNERFEQYINGKRENPYSNFTLRLKKILWEALSTPTLATWHIIFVSWTTSNFLLFQLILAVYCIKLAKNVVCELVALAHNLE
jgi:hypothetical protein